MRNTHQSDLRTDEHVRHLCFRAMDRYSSGNDWRRLSSDATVLAPSSAHSSARNAETPTATDQSQPCSSRHLSTAALAQSVPNVLLN
ncbi:hypothetical protein PBY51_010513 [Eleginops maclovinus]|uniref:Uncharacterized protein n=1 Tax=Eleginops maclovinus TaxID=56733 RepID=A0AAN7XAC0_ELEMC|nr:hypothetical protein PBY51_010513 [Eleginops maclovinus]